MPHILVEIALAIAHNAHILGLLVVMEGLLSADNAIALAVLVSRLPDRHQQQRALLYGIIGAFVFRAIAVIAAAWLIERWEFKALGALYLMYITGRYFWSGAHRTDAAAARGEVSAESAGGPVARFWPTVLTVELTDIAFSIDQIVAAVALSSELWIVYTGGMMGIVLMRFAAGGVLRVIEKRPMLRYTGHILPAWIGVKLILKMLGHAPFNLPVDMPTWLFWTVMAALVLWGVIGKPKEPAPSDTDADDEQTGAPKSTTEEIPARSDDE